MSIDRKMKLYVSADMEGIAGLAEYCHCAPGCAEFHRMVELLTWHINAIVQAALDAGIDEVLVNEAHSGMNYLNLAALHPRASLVSGYVKADNQMHGIDETFLGGVFIGHARAGTAGATLNHTYVMNYVYDVRLNGEPVGEIGLNALWAAYLGSRLLLVVGDDLAAAEAQAFEKTIQAAVVKQGISQFTAKHKSLTEVEEILSTRTKKAIELARAGEIRAPVIPADLAMEIDFSISEIAHLCSFVPGVERVGARTVRFENSDYRRLQQTRIVCTNLALSVARSRF